MKKRKVYRQTYAGGWREEFGDGICESLPVVTAHAAFIVRYNYTRVCLMTLSKTKLCGTVIENMARILGSTFFIYRLNAHLLYKQRIH